jgi:hypothetical protein
MDIVLAIIGVCIVLIGFTAFFGAPYVPSRKKFIKKAFDQLYPLSGKDTLVDIGSGDGIVLRIAAEYGAKAIGYELNPIFYLVSRVMSAKYDVEIALKNVWYTQIPDETTIVYIFSVSRDSKRMTRKLQNEVNRLGGPVHVMTFGSGLYNIEPIKVMDAYRLYLIRPLQPVKP